MSWNQHSRSPERGLPGSADRSVSPDSCSHRPPVAAGDLKGKAEGALEKTDLDEKLMAKADTLKDKAEDAVKGALDKTDIDEKIKDKVDDIVK